MIESAWGASPPLSVGVEEELMILDGETLVPVGAVDVFLRESEELELPGRLKTEMHAGHGGVSGRYASWKERAWELAWIIDTAGAGAVT